MKTNYKIRALTYKQHLILARLAEEYKVEFHRAHSFLAERKTRKNTAVKVNHLQAALGKQECATTKALKAIRVREGLKITEGKIKNAIRAGIVFCALAAALGPHALACLPAKAVHDDGLKLAYPTAHHCFKQLREPIRPGE